MFFDFSFWWFTWASILFYFRFSKLDLRPDRFWFRDFELVIFRSPIWIRIWLKFWLTRNERAGGKSVEDKRGKSVDQFKKSSRNSVILVKTEETLLFSFLFFSLGILMWSKRFNMGKTWVKQERIGKGEISTRATRWFPFLFHFKFPQQIMADDLCFFIKVHLIQSIVLSLFLSLVSFNIKYLDSVLYVHVFILGCKYKTNTKYLQMLWITGYAYR